MTDKNIKRLIESIDTIDNGKTAIEPAVDASVGIKLMGYKDPDGNARRLLVKGENVPTKGVFPETDDTHNVGGSANTYKDAFFKDENGVVFTARQLAKSIRGIFVSEDVPAYAAFKNWLLVLIYYWNYLLWSSDISQAAWTMTETTPLGTDGIISSAVSGIHSIFTTTMLSDTDGEEVTLSGEFKAGDVNGIGLRIHKDSLTRAGFDLSTLDYLEQDGTINAYKIEPTEEAGWFSLAIQTTSDRDGVLNATVYVATDETAAGRTFSGDGSTVSSYARKISLRPGTIAQNFPHLPTTTVPVSALAYVYEEKPIEGKLVNADTKVIETPVKNTLYIAPEPYQTMGGADTVYAQLISGTGYTATVTETIHGGGSVGRLIATAGGCYDFTNTEWLSDGYYVSSSYYVASKIVTTTLNIERGASMDDVSDDTHMWFYFTLA